MPEEYKVIPAVQSDDPRTATAQLEGIYVRKQEHSRKLSRKDGCKGVPESAQQSRGGENE